MESTALAFFCHGVQRSEVLLLQMPPSGVWDAAQLVLALMILMSRRSHMNLHVQRAMRIARPRTHVLLCDISSFV